MDKDQDIKAVLERIASMMEANASAIRLGNAPKIWQVEDIATWIGHSRGHTRDRVTKMPGFPKPISTGGWFMDEIVEWARLNRGKLKKAA